jgi:hypothetical protein
MENNLLLDENKVWNSTEKNLTCDEPSGHMTAFGSIFLSKSIVSFPRKQRPPATSLLNQKLRQQVKK